MDADEVESHKDLEMAAKIFREEVKDTLGLVAEASEMGEISMYTSCLFFWSCGNTLMSN